MSTLKMIEGADWTSSTGERNMREAKLAGLTRMPYHYLRPHVDRLGAVEARHCVRTVRRWGWRVGRLGVWSGRDLPICVDVERGGNELVLDAMTPQRFSAYLNSFCDEVRRLTKRGCVVYLSPGFAAELAGAPRNG
jgi:GH25 family lysozyme M1 (1,4-beta-N-acetylmuramidase)